MKKQTYTFQAETKELLNLMIHSLYSHREIFLRELISNASDAMEKLKFESLTSQTLGALESSFEIRLTPDKEKRTLTLSDTGIGMTQDEIIENIGTIAHSGTKAFLQAKTDIQNHPELIGQFGVGFYSAFMVADKVTLHTQKAGSQTGFVWESDGTGSYSLEELARPEGHGTTLTLHLKELKSASDSKQTETPDADQDRLSQDFTDPNVLRSIVKKYSDFVAYPIKMKVTHTTTKEGKPEITVEDETLNTQKALWLRPASEISKEEYNEFYRHMSHDWSEPLKTVHYKAEGTIEFTSIFYVPSQKPFDYDYRDHKSGLSLYVKRVLIKSDAEELIPAYLRFMKGMVDSDDLSLNVSRELLQQDRQILKIKKALTGKIIGSLRELIEQDRPGYEKFWTAFGNTVKEGIPTDPGNTEKLHDLLLFRSTHSDQLTSLSEYIGRMKPDQKSILYVTGDHLTLVQNSPYLEKPRAKGYEVLLMTDKVDAWVASSLTQYKEKPFQSVMAEDLELDTAEEKEAEKQKLQEMEIELKPLILSFQEALKEQVKEVKLSERLTDSPVCLVASGGGMSAHMERILESMGQSLPKTKRTLEINPKHPLFEKMRHAPTGTQQEWAEILYQQALLNEGSQIENPLQYTQNIAKLMLNALDKSS